MEIASVAFFYLRNSARFSRTPFARDAILPAYFTSTVGTIELLNIFEITVKAAVLLDQFLTHAPDFFQDRITHSYRVLRMACPNRTWGIDSGDTIKGAIRLNSPQSSSNRRWTTGLAIWG